MQSTGSRPETVQSVFKLSMKRSSLRSYLLKKFAFDDLLENMKNRPQLTTQITKWGLRDAGFAYNIVSVFGSQSTGKSAPFVLRRCSQILTFHRYTVEQTLWDNF